MWLGFSIFNKLPGGADAVVPGHTWNSKTQRTQHVISAGWGSVQLGHGALGILDTEKCDGKL
jgi:hypothetical protein